MVTTAMWSGSGFTSHPGITVCLGLLFPCRTLRVSAKIVMTLLNQDFFKEGRLFWKNKISFIELQLMVFISLYNKGPVLKR